MVWRGERIRGKGGTHPDRLDLQFQCGVLIADNHRVGVQLQGRQRPHMVDTLLDASLQGQGLACTQGQHHDLAGFQDRLDTDRQGHFWDLVQVVIEEAAVGEDGAICKGLDTSTGRQAGAGFVEGDVAVLTHASEEEVDASSSLDLRFVLDALSLKAGSVAIEDVHVAGVDVHVGKEVLPHEGVVALRVVPGDSDVLILRGASSTSRLAWEIPRLEITHHVESDDIFEGHLCDNIRLERGPLIMDTGYLSHLASLVFLC